MSCSSVLCARVAADIERWRFPKSAYLFDNKIQGMSSVIVYPRKGPMTQGTIFSCAIAEDYTGCPTYGLVLTAGCDVAHDKVRVHNYIPIVHLDDWLHRDGRIILAQRLLSEAMGAMRSTLKEAGHSPSILETENPEQSSTSSFRKAPIANCARDSRSSAFVPNLHLNVPPALRPKTAACMSRERSPSYVMP